MISTGGHITILESVDSTNNYAMAGVRQGHVKHGDAFFAMEQHAGKGQRSKTWQTEPGSNIIITLALRPGVLLLPQQFRFSMAIALAAHDFFSHYAGSETTVKWPNDIYWRDRKAGGILIENVVGAELLSAPSGSTGNPSASSGVSAFNNWQWAITGIGININQTVFPEFLQHAVSLKQITGRHWDVIALAKELCDCIHQRYQQLQTGIDLLPAYNATLYKKGEPARFKTNGRVFNAVVKEVTCTGELVLSGGMDEEYSFGEIEWLIGD